MKIAKAIICLVLIVLSVHSIIELIIVCVDLFKCPFDLTSEGFQNYLNAFKPYAGLFGGTVGLFALYSAIENNYIAQSANSQSIWNQNILFQIDNIRDQDPKIEKEIKRYMNELFSFVHSKDFIFRNEQDTKQFFDEFFTEKIYITDLESGNKEYKEIQCYRDKNQSYAFTNLHSVIAGMVLYDNCYQNFSSDFKKFYFEELNKKHADRYIDPANYEIMKKKRTERIMEERK